MTPAAGVGRTAPCPRRTAPPPRLEAKGTRTYGYVLLLHPNDALERLREDGKVPDWWWGLFTDLVLDTGTVLRLEKKREEGMLFDTGIVIGNAQ